MTPRRWPLIALMLTLASTLKAAPPQQHTRAAPKATNHTRVVEDAPPQSEIDVFKQTASFATLLTNDSTDKALMDDLGEACGKFVQNIYRSGKTLRSDVLRAAAKPIEGHKYPSGVHEPAFYHWSKGNELPQMLRPDLTNRELAQADALKKGVYDQIFYYYRVTRGPDHYKMWRRVHYLAEDRESSGFLGDRLIKFYMSPKSKIIPWNDRTWIAALEEMNRRYQGFQEACGTDLPIVVHDTYRSIRFNETLFMIAEDSGIDLIDYQTGQWFQLVRPNNIVKTEIIQ